MEADLQGYHWTGCRLLEGRPAIVRDKEAQVDVEQFKTDVERNIIISRNFESQRDADPHSYPSSLMFHLLRTIFSRASSHPELRNLHVARGYVCRGSVHVRIPEEHRRVHVYFAVSMCGVCGSVGARDWGLVGVQETCC